MVRLFILLAPAAMTAETPENLIRNGGFEVGLASWRFGCLRGVPSNPYAASRHGKVTLDAKVFAEGRQSARLDGTMPYDDADPRAVLEQQIPNLPAGCYKLTWRYRFEGECDKGFGFVLVDWTGQGTKTRRLPPPPDNTGRWRSDQITFEVSGPAQPGRVLLYLKGKGALWYDDVRLVRVGEAERAKASQLGPRDYHITTRLVDGGKAQCVIVSSRRRESYAGIARQIQGKIKSLTGVAPDVVDADDATPEDILGRAGAIVLGNLVTSRFVEALYWQWYTLLDLWYPGPGGYVLRTLHDPYGTGRNVILLGGSDDQGVADAAKAFLAVLSKGGADERGTLHVGRLMDVKLGAGHAMPPKGQWVDPRLRVFNPDLDLPLGYTEASRAGLIYHYNGNEKVGQRFRELALTTNVLTASDHYTQHMHVIVWDLIEESPIFSDEDRRVITAKLLEHARGRDGSDGIGTLTNYPTHKHLLDRHASMQAICTLVESRYFGKYWPDAEWDRNVRAVRKYFDRQMTTGKGDSDLGGRGIYSYLECALIPALLLRDRRFVESGALRHYAELCLMHCDNTGFMPNTGQSSSTSYPTETLRKAATLLRDGGFLATMKRRTEAERAVGLTDSTMEFTAGQAWEIGIQPKPMDKMVGVYHLPLTAWEHEVRGKTVPIAQSFDKLTMRTGFERDDQYLLLDGLHGGPPGKPWPDVNSIAHFGQNGRVFLVSDLGGANPVNHNVVTVCKDGLGAVTGRVASLEATADLPGFGHSHSRAAKHAFSTWDRHLFWRKGAWFVVLDSLVVNEPGRYAFECQWRSIGEPKLSGSDFSTTLRERAKPDAPRDVLHIKSAERYPLRFSEQASGLFGGPDTKRWAHYCRRNVINRLRQVSHRRMQPGEEQIFTNLVYVGGDRTEAEYEIAKIEDRVVVLTGSESAYVGLADGGEFERAGVRIVAQAFLIVPTCIAAVGAECVQAPDIDVKASTPCNLELNLTTGRVSVESAGAATITANGVGYEFEAGLHGFNLQTHTDELMAALAEEMRRDAAEARRPPTATTTAPRNDLPAVPVAWTFEAGAAVLGLHAADVNGDGRTETLVGLGDGRAVCLDELGKPRWTFKAGGPVRAVSSAVVDAGRAAVVGSDDECVYALAAESGKVLWKHKCRLPELIYTWWTTEMKAKLQAILCDDVDGDGKVEIVCGTGGGCVETIGSDGKARWMTQIQWGIPDRLAVVPMPDGAKTILVDNGYSSCGSTTWRLAASGKLLSANACPTGRGAWDMTAIPGLKVVDLDASGKPNVIIGRRGAYNEVGLYDAVTGKRSWLHTLGDSGEALEAMDVTGDGVKEVIVGSPSSWLCAFDATGKTVWAEPMPHEILAVTQANDCLLVACADEAVYRVGLDGQVAGRTSLAGRPYRLFATAASRRIIGDASGRVVALDP
ncbi:MAG: PQQ-binding-like beta-propeller repeat protein [Phycisphaerae bacterium]|nr:PQQ-binding-like beta-propeller repeat protein [Phycisphaerae bacterium]